VVEDSTAAGEAEDFAAAEDFPVDMGLAAAEDFAAEAAGLTAAVPSAVALAGVHFVVAATSDVVTEVSVAAGMDVDGAAGTGVDTGAATGLYSASATVIPTIGPTITTLIIPILITLTLIPTATIHTHTIRMLTGIRVTATIHMANTARKRGL
jgi:hypothetical protein